MYLSRTQTELTTAYIDKNLFTEHHGLMRLYTVKLFGSVFNNTLFTATGVIYRADSDGVYILTAKHNLHVAAKSTGTLNSGLVDYFKSKVKVRYEIGGVTTDGVITRIRIPDDSPADGGHDVIELRVGALAFKTKILELLTPATSKHWLYASNAWRRERSIPRPPPFFDFLDAEDAEAVLANGDLPDWNTRKGTFTDHVLLQFGHGQISSGGRYGFSERALKIADLEERTQMATTHEGYKEVFTFKTNSDNTALPGDSGGPIFAIDDKGENAWLIGLHLGANIYAGRTDDSDDIKNNAFTIVTSALLDSLT